MEGVAGDALRTLAPLPASGLGLRAELAAATHQPLAAGVSPLGTDMRGFIAAYQQLVVAGNAPPPVVHGSRAAPADARQTALAAAPSEAAVAASPWAPRSPPPPCMHAALTAGTGAMCYGCCVPIGDMVAAARLLAVRLEHAQRGSGGSTPGLQLGDSALGTALDALSALPCCRSQALTHVVPEVLPPLPKRGVRTLKQTVRVLAAGDIAAAAAAPNVLPRQLQAVRAARRRARADVDVSASALAGEGGGGPDAAPPSPLVHWTLTRHAARPRGVLRVQWHGMSATQTALLAALPRAANGADGVVVQDAAAGVVADAREQVLVLQHAPELWTPPPPPPPLTSSVLHSAPATTVPGTTGWHWLLRLQPAMWTALTRTAELALPAPAVRYTIVERTNATSLALDALALRLTAAIPLTNPPGAPPDQVVPLDPPVPCAGPDPTALPTSPLDPVAAAPPPAIHPAWVLAADVAHPATARAPRPVTVADFQWVKRPGITVPPGWRRPHLLLTPNLREEDVAATGVAATPLLLLYPGQRLHVEALVMQDRRLDGHAAHRPLRTATQLPLLRLRARDSLEDWPLAELAAVLLLLAQPDGGAAAAALVMVTVPEAEKASGLRELGWVPLDAAWEGGGAAAAPLPPRAVELAAAARLAVGYTTPLQPAEVLFVGRPAGFVPVDQPPLHADMRNRLEAATRAIEAAAAAPVPAPAPRDDVNRSGGAGGAAGAAGAGCDGAVEDAHSDAASEAGSTASSTHTGVSSSVGGASVREGGDVPPPVERLPPPFWELWTVPELVEATWVPFGGDAHILLARAAALLAAQLSNSARLLRAEVAALRAEAAATAATAADTAGDGSDCDEDPELTRMLA